jgi:hypothetical protein
MKQLPEPILRGMRREFAVESLFRIPAVQPTQPHERALLCWILPAWQRPEVWDEQRLGALRDFVGNALPVFDGSASADLSTRQQRRFMSTSFPCIELANQDDEQRLREIYDRRNLGGVAHTQAHRERASRAAWGQIHDTLDHAPARAGAEGVGHGRA